jgi:uncharacterized delta-60 repeat protein
MKTLLLRALILPVLLVLPARLLAQAGSVDSSFNPALNSGAQVYAVTVQTNGQILIGGTFTSVGGVGVTNVARLNPNGTLDATFNPGAAANGNGSYVTAIAVQPDGKVLIGGLFFSTTGATPANLARLNPNGTVDSSFDYDLYVGGNVNALAIQSDGKILLGGGFVAVDGLVRRSVARLHTNGTLDTNFDACIAFSPGNGASALALRDDGRILMSGNFTFSTGTNRNGIALLGTNGDLDHAYFPEPGVNSNSYAWTLARRSSGEVLLAGDFKTYHGLSRSGIVQLATNGTPDVSFDPGSGINDGATNFALVIQRDGKVLVGGDFGSYNGQTKSGVARVNPNGTLDPAFDVGAGANAPAAAIALQEDGKVLVVGRFSSFNTVPRNGVVRLKGDPAPARLDPTGWVAGGQFQLTFFGEYQAHYAIERSSNLVDWVSMTNLTASSNSVPILDPQTSPVPKQFYRALLLP